jgi:hypothetical protein
MSTRPADILSTMRRLLMALAAAALVGIATELVLLEHYEDGWMIIPLGMIALCLGALVLHRVADSAATVRLVRGTMALLAVSGAVGVVLHYQGSLAFQIDMDPTLSSLQLFWKVMHMKAPPTMAPGVLVQVGLLGLLSTYRHPALRRSDYSTTTGA